ncbi:B3 domain-containing protein REM16-like isoform X2 [Euphorbia lathyris]|uniref:B3 domain-containing protein REM16-like isoform X2 n=1 Tax=Euphorbia lathyris TaxID=212925 RepID=UPI003313EA76
MVSNPKSTITFIKFLVFDFATEIKLPSLFVKMFEKLIPKLCILRSHTGKSCVVSIVRDNNGYFFFRQGWDKFLKENELKEGDVLVFNLVDATTFEVLAYGSTCCLKEVPQIQNSTSESENISSKPQIQNPTSESEKISSKPQISARNTENGDAKRGRKVVKKRDNEKPVAKQTESEEQYSVKLTLKEYQKHNVEIPRNFATKAGLKHKNKVVIECPEGRKWGIQVWSRKEQAFLSTGWADFVKANGLNTGDTYILRTVQDNPNLIRAQILKHGSKIIKSEC